MRIFKLMANQAWVVLFGDQIIDIDGVRFFPSRASVVLTLLEKGLYVSKTGEIS